MRLQGVWKGFFEVGFFRGVCKVAQVLFIMIPIIGTDVWGIS